MLRSYNCDIIGDGTEDNPFRPKIAEYPVSWVASVPTNQVTGTPASARCAVEVDADESMHETLLADPQIEAL